MSRHGEAEIRRQTVGDVVPGVRAVIGPIETPVVLQEQAIRPIRMPNDLVHALPELRKPLRHERNADAPVARLPGPAAIIGPVNACRGNSHMHSPGVGRMLQDRVQTQTAHGQASSVADGDDRTDRALSDHDSPASCDSNSAAGSTPQ